MSRWQSAVATVARDQIKESNPDIDPEKLKSLVANHPMVLGTNLHVNEFENNGRDLRPEHIQSYLPNSEKKAEIHPIVHAYLSQEHFKKTLELANDPEGFQLKSATAPLIGTPIEFPDSDYAYLQWAKCAVIWGKDGNPIPGPYIDIDDHGGASSNFGVVTIPANSKIAILGDFGTGLNDATTMLIALLEQLDPDIIIHLGDIYYSGTKDECKTYVDTFNTAFKKAGKKVPVFSVPGNHEYYAGGWGFFESVVPMNKNNGFTELNQEASFFALQTDDKNWQFLGMDTGYNSVHNFNIAHPTQVNASYAPWLTFSEASWHQNKLETFTGKTVLLSHHQLFSSHSIINDGKGVTYKSGTDKKSLEYLNHNLLAVFQPYFAKVAAWFWGHEHVLNIFEDNQLGLAKGRLVGNSGYEEWKGEDPYKPTGSSYKDHTPPAELGSSPVSWSGSNFDFLNHGFTMITLNGSNAKADYYQYPVYAPSASIPSNPPKLIPFPFSDPKL
ncbi:hypothetical protein GCM10022258_03270 [Aquimarina gracilis]